MAWSVNAIKPYGGNTDLSL